MFHHPKLVPIKDNQYQYKDWLVKRYQTPKCGQFEYWWDAVNTNGQSHTVRATAEQLVKQLSKIKSK